MQKSILLVVGTRPEGIKMMPLYYELKQARLPVLLASTGQHTDLLYDVFKAFDVQPDIDLALGRPQQDLAYLTQAVLSACTALYEKINPALVVVQGDTTTVMAAGLAAFYKKIAILHVEAGLRTGDIKQPYPEEMNRRVLSLVTDYHCAPTSLAVANLLAEGVAREKIFCTGNPVVDALRMTQDSLQSGRVSVDFSLRKRIEQEKKAGKKIVLLTAHRRESFDGGIASILNAAQKISAQHENVFFIYPTHPNPQVQHALEQSLLAQNKNFLLLNALAYQDLVYALMAADIVMTDSGGIQEEAVSLGKPTLVLREKTERVEGVWEGVAHLVGTGEEKIISTFENIFARGAHCQENGLYGDGHAAKKITAIIAAHLHGNVPQQLVMREIKKINTEDCV